MGNKLSAEHIKADSPLDGTCLKSRVQSFQLHLPFDVLGHDEPPASPCASSAKLQIGFL